ncbi:hypothetical protein [Streptomyces oceani]|nr:hypothetical protein [Streptomyces oceani]
MFVTSATLVTALVGGLSACTGSSGAGGDSGDPKPGDSSATPASAPSGKYRTLPEPCGAVSVDTLEKMLPGETADSQDDDPGSITDPPPEASPSPYEGEASVTYDTDRRAGCTWKSTTSKGSHHLSIDFERVVSYDPDISDDEQSEALYAKRAEKAGVDPSAEPSELPSDSPSPSSSSSSSSDSSDSPKSSETSGSSGSQKSSEDTESSKGDRKSGDTGQRSGETPQTVPPSPGTSASTLAARTLDDVGDAAFIDDELTTTGSGVATRRDVQLTCRTANVLVTVKYSESAGDGHRAPDSAELQEQTEDLAQQLVDTFDD